MNLALFTRVLRIGSLAGLVSVASLLVAPQSSFASSTITFTAPTFTESETPAQVGQVQNYTAQITISDTVATDLLAGYGLDLFASTTPGNVLNPMSLPNNLLETSVVFTGFNLNTTPAYVYNNTTGARRTPTSTIRMTSPSPVQDT